MLRGTSSATRTLDERDLAALRPAAAGPGKRRRPQRREPQDRSLTFFCSNPQCDHKTWAPARQAQHMAREFWEVAKALVRLAPDSPEALRLTGGVILADLTDDECRAAHAAYQRLRRADAGVVNGRPVEQMTTPVYLAYLEYGRRVHDGILAPAGQRAGRVPRTECPACGAEWSEENTYQRKDGRQGCRRCRRKTDAAAQQRRRRAKAQPGSSLAVREWLREQGRGNEIPAHGPVPGWARVAYETIAGNGETGERTMITAAHIRELADAEYTGLPVLSRDGEDFRVEPQSTAASHGRPVITDANAVENWSGGEPMSDAADCEQFAAEVNTGLAETGDQS